MIEANSDVLIAEMSKLEITDMNQVLPTEILRKILQRLDIPSLCVARQTCKRWKGVIDGFDLVKEACSKYFKSSWRSQSASSFGFLKAAQI